MDFVVKLFALFYFIFLANINRIFISSFFSPFSFFIFRLFCFFLFFGAFCSIGAFHSFLCIIIYRKKHSYNFYIGFYFFISSLLICLLASEWPSKC